MAGGAAWLGIQLTLTDEEESEMKNFFIKYDRNANGMLEVCTNSGR